MGVAPVDQTPFFGCPPNPGVYEQHPTDLMDQIFSERNKDFRVGKQRWIQEDLGGGAGGGYDQNTFCEDLKSLLKNLYDSFNYHIACYRIQR